jgi:hypothetical protein
MHSLARPGCTYKSVSFHVRPTSILPTHLTILRTWFPYEQYAEKTIKMQSLLCTNWKCQFITLSWKWINGSLLREAHVCDHMLQSVTSCRSRTASKSRQGAGLIVDAQTSKRNVSLPIWKFLICIARHWPSCWDWRNCPSRGREELGHTLPRTEVYSSWISSSTETENSSKSVPNHTR